MVALQHKLSEYSRFYNDERLHDSLGKCIPSEDYDGIRDAS